MFGTLMAFGDNTVSLAVVRSRQGFVAAVFWWAAALPTVFISLTLPLWPDGFRQSWYGSYGELLFLGLAAVAAFWRAEFGRHGLLRHWWRSFSLALGLWYLTTLLAYLGLVGDGPLWSVLAGDFGYACYFLTVVLMLDRMSGRPQRFGASIALILALFGYIIVLPAWLAPEEYRGWMPSYLFYVSLDLYIFGRISLILRSVWRTRIGLDLALFWLVFAGILISDVIDGFWNLELISVRSTDWRAPLFYLPLLPLLLLTSPIWRLRWQHAPFVPERRPIPDLERIVYWLLPLALHLIGYGFALLDPGLRVWRDSYLLVWLLVVFAFEVHRRYRVADFDEPIERPGSEPEPATIPPAASATGQPLPEPDPLLARLDDYLAAHLSEHGLSLEQIGSKLALSPRQIQRRLKAATGLSPSQYLLEKRLQYAARLLKEGHKGGYVAQASGFSQQSHFTRRFKEHYGLTPGQYARQS